MSQRKAKMQRREEAAHNSLPQIIKTLESLHRMIKTLHAQQDAVILALEARGLLKREEWDPLASELAEKYISALEESKHESGG